VTIENIEASMKNHIGHGGVEQHPLAVTGAPGFFEIAAGNADKILFKDGASLQSKLDSGDLAGIPRIFEQRPTPEEIAALKEAGELREGEKILVRREWA
jgi:hypothetical protein